MEDRKGFRAIKRQTLIGQLQKLLDQYSDGQIIKELIQNAEDGGANKVKILFVNQQYETGTRTWIEDPVLFGLKGPALCVYNDGIFNQDDWESIAAIQCSAKENKPLQVGRFGLGFKSVFHITALLLAIDFNAARANSTVPCTPDLDQNELCPEFRARGLCSTFLHLWCSCPYSCDAPPYCQATPIKDSSCKCGNLAPMCEIDQDTANSCLVTCLVRKEIQCDILNLPMDPKKEISDRPSEVVRYLDQIRRTCKTQYTAVHGTEDVYVCQIDTSFLLDYSKDELICGDKCDMSLNFNASTCNYWAEVGECIFKLDYWCRCSYSCMAAPFCQAVNNEDLDCNCGRWAKMNLCSENDVKSKCKTTCMLRESVTCDVNQLPSEVAYTFVYKDSVRYLDIVTINCSNDYITTAGDYISMACQADGIFTRSFYHSTITCQSKIPNTSPAYSKEICFCGCSNDQTLPANVSSEEVARKRSMQIQEDLLVDSRNLSATIRKKISVPDSRPSSKGFGLTAGAILCGFVTCLVLFDLRAMYKHMQILKRNLCPE